MLEITQLDRVLCLPAVDITALLKGQLIAVIPRVSVQKGWSFALYPCPESTNTLNFEQQYRSPYWSLASTAFSQYHPENAAIEAWARCEHCTILHEPQQVEALSSLTIWTKDALRKNLSERNHLFLALLRVYQLSEPIKVSNNAINTEKCGKFVGLNFLGEQFVNSIQIEKSLPILSDLTFHRQQRRLIELRPFPYSELEELQSLVAQTITSHAAETLVHDIRTFLSWSDSKAKHTLGADLTWIKTITELGERSKEQDDGKKSNYQAGTDFEIIVRNGLEFIGFKVEEAFKGGAGGLDLFCSHPYPLVGECKAGRSIPDRAVEELDRIGKRHLKENFLTATRLIIGPGQPTRNLQDSAQISKTSIITAMTFEKLVELQAKYPGSVDLIDLKQYLVPGMIDYKIDEYVEKTLKEIKLRSQMVKAVKQLADTEPDRRQFEVAEIRVQYNIAFGRQDNAILDNQTVHELLIELSSPLTGYLGRVKGTSLQTDRFYFLRDFPEDDSSLENKE